jgi:hypothetical protein
MGAGSDASLRSSVIATDVSGDDIDARQCADLVD